MSDAGDRVFVWFQYLLPKKRLSRLIHWLARIRTKWFKNAYIGFFRSMFKVDVSEALINDPFAFPTFNDFFTRELRPGARPLDPAHDAVICPVDGTVSEAGAIDGDRLLQAKDKTFTLAALLADQSLAQNLADGSFATIYLAPYNYHRIHMPCAGRLVSMTHVPGKLFSVNQATARQLDRLFAINERIVCRFETIAGPMVMVLVGAFAVGSIETVWAGEVTSGLHKAISTWSYQEQNIVLERGDEMGRFNMGSTVIVLFGKDAVVLDASIRRGQTVWLGNRLATWLAQDCMT